jgi:hypothetical protein
MASGTIMSEVPPGGYNPESPTPYSGGRSGAGGQGGGPPQITAPPPSAVSQEPPPTAPSVLPGSKGAKAASIAYGLDAVLRGAMRGREQAQQQSAFKANKLMQGFQYAYKNASDQYLGMLQNDPALAAKLGELDKIGKTKNPTAEQQARAKEISSDPSVVKAQQVASAADSAWQAQQQMYNNYLNPQSGKKPKSGKSKGGDQSGDAQSPVMQIQSKDPMEKLQGYLAISKAAGPSYKREAAYYMSPEYQQSRANAVGEQQITSDIQAKRIELHKLQNADPATLDDKAKQRLEQLRTDPELFPQVSRTVPHYGTSDIPGASLSSAKDSYGNPVRDKFGNAIDPKQDYRIETLDGVQSYVPAVSRASQGKPRTGWSKDAQGKFFSANIDPKTNQFVPGTENYSQQPPANLMETIRHGFSTFVDGSGDTWQIPVTSTTQHVAPGTGGGTGSGAASGSGTGSGHGGAHTGAGSSATAAAAAQPADTSTDHIPPVPGAKYVGHKMDQETKMVDADAIKGAAMLRPLAGVLKTQEEYMAEIEKDPSKATPRQDLSMVVSAVRAMNPGSNRLPKTELEWERMTGSYADQLRRWYDNAQTGTLPPDQRKDLFGIIKKELTNSGKMAVDNWKEAFQGRKPVPAYLQQFDTGDGGGPSGGANKTHAGTPSKLSPEQEKLLDQYFPH